MTRSSVRFGLLAFFAFGLLLLGVVLFWRATDLLSQKEYVGCVLVVLMGLGSLQAGADLCRLLYVERDA